MALWFQLKQVVLHTSHYSCNYVTSRFQFVSNSTDSWVQIWFSLNTLDPAFHKAGSRQALLRAALEPGANNEHVLPSPQPTQTSAPVSKVYDLKGERHLFSIGSDNLGKRPSQSKMSLPIM